MRSYVWAVEELTKLAGRHKEYAEYEYSIVLPAREVCQKLLRAWMEEFGHRRGTVPNPTSGD